MAPAPVPPEKEKEKQHQQEIYNTGHTSHASFAYLAIRALFLFVLKVFYSNIVVEGVEHIPKDGTPCILTANHSNSLTDALLLVTTVPRWRRSLLRLTAKSGQFNRGTFTSWLIASAGTLPIQRPKDFSGKKVDNAIVFEKLIHSLERGDMVCMFPEGMSRYWPEIAPLRQGVARIIGDTLARRKDVEGFQIAVQTCSITYLHRNLFRSDVLVTFHPPLLVSSTTHPGLATTPASEPSIRSLTSSIASSIRSGILDAPSWSLLRCAHTARRLYAPLGTKLGLGEHVRLTQRFVEGLDGGGKRAEREWSEGGEGEGKSVKEVLKTPMVEREGEGYFGSGGERLEGDGVDVKALVRDLKIYQDLLYLHGVKDDRVRNPRMLRRRTLLKRLFVRLAGASFLLIISLPGLLLWMPVFLVAHHYSEKNKKSGPVFDTYDEVAQTKVTYGFITGMATYTLFLLFTLPILPLSLPLFPILLWLSLRWLEDLTSSLRASLALFRLLYLGKAQLVLLRSMREGLRVRVEELAVKRCGLPRDAEKYFLAEEKKRPRWKEASGFFSIKRRRKKDWNEALKLWDVTSYPELEELPPAPPSSITTESRVEAVKQD